MTNRPRLRAYPSQGTITIQDGETYPIAVSGNFVSVKTANTGFKIVLDGTDELSAAQNRRFKMQEGDVFRKIDVVNDSGSDLTFQLEIGFGGVESDDVTINGTVKTSGGAAVSYGNKDAGTSALEIIAANSNRTGWSIQNVGTSNIYIGDDASVTTTTGWKIPPGGAYGEDSQAAVYAIGDAAVTGGAANVRYREVTS